eukprot:GFKZ01006349.1.p1 GENE.GFKZ01006349.1~~GFKZ01006349.1.p1  ORF type:complete len:174 (-),score=23.81 GFKZ01006349.1:293-814(-)
MEPVGFALGVLAFVEQTANAIHVLCDTLKNYASNPAYLDTVQTLADSLSNQLKTLASRFYRIAPSLTSLQLTCLEFHIQSLYGHFDEVSSSLDKVHEANTRIAYPRLRANRIARELKSLHGALRDVERDAQALHANLSTFEMSDQSTAAVLDAVYNLSFLILALFTMGLIAAF